MSDEKNSERLLHINAIAELCTLALSSKVDIKTIGNEQTRISFKVSKLVPIIESDENRKLLEEHIIKGNEHLSSSSEQVLQSPDGRRFRTKKGQKPDNSFNQITEFNLIYKTLKRIGLNITNTQLYIDKELFRDDENGFTNLGHRYTYNLSFNTTPEKYNQAIDYNRICQTLNCVHKAANMNLPGDVTGLILSMHHPKGATTSWPYPSSYYGLLNRGFYSTENTHPASFLSIPAKETTDVNKVHPASFRIK
jgi:hypothetical protein